MNLPENWTYKNIEEIAEVVTGSTPSKKHSEYYENEFPFYKPTDLNAGYYSKKSADGLSKLGLENARFIPEKSILVTSIGATMNILNLGIIKDLPFPFCSISEQQAIVQEIDSRLSVCDKIEQTVEDSLKKAEALRQSILKKAFEGELTRDWREKHQELITGENSAEKLLERIKAEKALPAVARKEPRSKKMKKK